MRQLGTIVSELARLRLDKIGSLFEDGGVYTIKECLSTGHVWRGRDLLAIDRGPFDQESDYYTSLISANIMHAKELPMETHAFFAPVPVPSEYSSWASYISATDRWNDFITVGERIDHSQN